jgi:phosphomannomutase
MPAKFFKSYDIRGTYPEITPEVFYLAGKGLVLEVLQKENLPTKVAVCHDTRLTSELFYKALIRGILDGGGEVIPLGIASSDFLYAASQYNNIPGAIITASHNPKDDNGVKIVKHGSTMLGMDEGLGKVRDYVVANFDTVNIDFESLEMPVLDENNKNEVIKYFKSKIEEIGKISEVESLLAGRNQKIKIAVDAGNAMGGWIMNILKDMYKQVEFIPLYWELDGNYPNHPANPQEFENLKDLQKVVTEDSEIAFGFAFDGDADRVGFIDEKAEVIQGDFLAAFFASTLLEDYRKKPDPRFTPSVVYITPGSMCVPESIAIAGGVAVPSKQGHTYIKARMQEFKAIYGGEFSGHHYFADFGYMDSGVLTAVLMIKIFVMSGKSLSETFKYLNESYFISNLVSFKIPDGETFETLKIKAKENFADSNGFSEYDGLAVYYSNWKFSMRPSGTEPVVRMILETKFKNETAEKMALVKKVLGLE